MLLVVLEAALLKAMNKLTRSNCDARSKFSDNLIDLIEMEDGFSSALRNQQPRNLIFGRFCIPKLSNTQSLVSMLANLLTP